MRIFCLLCLTSLLLGFVPDAGAETRYVNDQLVLTLRSTPNQNGEVIGHPRTNDPLEVLAEEGDYVKVRDTDGREGFVLKQYLTSETPKTILIARLEKQLAGLQEQLASRESGGQEQQQELEQLRTTKQQLEDVLATNQQELEQLKKDYERLLANSNDLVNIVAERDQLKQTNQALESEAIALRDENKSLLVSAMIKWFLAGAGVLFFGWVIGKASRRRQRPF